MRFAPEPCILTPTHTTHFFYFLFPQTITEFAKFASAPSSDDKHTSPAERKLHKILDAAHAQGLQYEDAFDEFDTNGDGEISHSEFTRAVKEIFGPTKLTLSSSEIDALLDVFDKSKNGYITMKDFTTFARGSRNRNNSDAGASSLGTDRSLATELRKIIRYSERKHNLSLRAAFCRL